MKYAKYVKQAKYVQSLRRMTPPPFRMTDMPKIYTHLFSYDKYVKKYAEYTHTKKYVN